MITIEDLIKYGLARDIEPVRQESLAERGAFYSRQIARLDASTDKQLAQLQEAGKTKQAKSVAKTYGRELDKIEKDRDAAFERINERFNKELASYERLLERPETIRQISSLRSAEQEKELSRVRSETEAVQRESAERQASRVRARGGRGGRQMLASARLSPQGMGVGGESTLGAAPF